MQTSLSDGHSSGVSWSAILAGAAAAGALSFILLILGLGLGLSSLSPYLYNAGPVGAAAVIWVCFTQLAASAVGGYLAGRLRLRWPTTHTDEVYFRDTAHGLLVWSIATLLTVALLAGAGRAALSGSLELAQHQPNETDRVIAAAVASGGLAAEDRNYLANSFVLRQNMAMLDAERRVDELYQRAAEAANRARKAAANSALWMFVALLLGAFVASFSATYGGRLRDKVSHTIPVN